MDRSLQSALEKRSRMGKWQPRVYRLERGYLSTWPDVVSAANKEPPSKTECLWQEKQVAVLSDQGDRRFRLDFPWAKDTNEKALQLRSSDASMKKAWMNLLTATLKEAASQIEGTGGVFAYGGVANHVVDEAYEEAAFLTTNRFLAAYVVDEQNRASYINDHLNESFQHQDQGTSLGSVAGGAMRACEGARSAINELLALMEDYKEEMRGIDELQRGPADSSAGLDPTVAAPKLRKFCAEHLALSGRLVASRLMLELMPFMDACVEGTSAAPTDETRQELVSTRQKIDEMYIAAERLSVMGKRGWLMDIRGAFLDSSGLQNAVSQSARSPSPPPRSEPVQQAPSTVDSERAPSPPGVDTTESSSAVRRPSKMFLQVSSAMSAAKAMTAGSFLASSAAAAAPGDNASPGNDGAGQDEQDSSTTSGMTSTAALATRLSRTALSLKSFRRPSVRTPDTADDTADDPPKGSPKTLPEADDRLTVPPQPGGGISAEVCNAADSQQSSRAVFAPESGPGAGQHGHISLYENSSSSSHASRAFADEGMAAETESLPSQSPPVSRHLGSQYSIGSSECGAAPATVSSSIPAVGSNTSPSTSSSARGGRRAFAGGLWNRNSGSRETTTTSPSVADTTPDGDQQPTMVASTAAHAAETFAPAPKPSSSSGGGRRRFAGGGFGGAGSSSPAGGGRSDNPFGAGVGEGSASNRGAVASGIEGESRGISPKGGAGVQSTPSWAVSKVDSADDVPDWARGAGDVATSTGSVGLAPPSRSRSPGVDADSKQSPLLAPDADIPVSKPNPRRMIRGAGGGGAGGQRRAFGGGESLF